MSVPAFGSAMRQQEFLDLDPAITFLNHGSRGVVAKRVKDAQIARLTEFDADPETFIQRTSDGLWTAALDAAAPFFGTTTANLSFTENTTYGLNSVIKSLPLQSGDAILFNKWTYGSVKYTIQEKIAKTPGILTVEMDHAYPIVSSANIIQQYTDTLNANTNIKAVVIDYISSSPAILFPVEQLASVCKSNGVPYVIIDAAHCTGQVNFNLDTLGVDFLAASVHKWLYTPRGTGILYVAPAHHSLMQPAVISWEYNDPYPGCFFDFGATRDPCPILVIPDGINFFNWAGGWNAISTYISDLVTRNADMLVAAWGTGKLQIPLDMEAPYLRVVRVPDMPNYPKNGTGSGQLTTDLRDIYNIWAATGFYLDEINIRLSGQIYCEDADFILLRDAVLALQAASPAELQKKRKRRRPYKFVDTGITEVNMAAAAGKKALNKK